MVSEKLIAFILKARQNKRNDDQIVQQLLSVGWKQEAIADAFSEIKSKKITAPTAAQAAKAAQAQQPAQTAPPWVKPAASAQPASPAMQPSAQATAAPVSSAPQQPSSAPQPAAQPAPAPSTAPVQQAPAVQAQTPPIIPTPQPTPQSPIPPASPIQLPAQKKSFFSSLFGKKQPPAPTAQPAAPQPQAPAQQPAPAQQAAPAARPPIFPPRAPAAQPPAASAQPPIVQGQSTLPIFAGAPAQQSAAGTMPSGTAPPLAQQTQPPASQAPSAPLQPPAKQAKPAAGIMKFLPIIVFVVILAAAGAYYVFVMAPSSSPPPVQTPPIVQQNASGNQTQLAAGPSDCGTDMDCFVQASAACRPAKVVRNSSTDFSGMLLLGSTYMEIQNASEAGKCSLYSKALDSSVKLSDASVAAALAKGISIDEIRRQEADSTRQAKAVVGLSGTCTYSTSALSAMLGRWNAGNFAGSDYAGAGCTGKLYSSMQPDGSFSANITLPNLTAITNTSAKPNATAPAPANTTKANTTAANSTTPSNSTNASAPAIPPKNTTTANATSPANNSTAATFAYSRKYTTYYPEHLVWFCTDRNSEFYRMHWVEFFGGDCNVPKPKDGFVSFDNYTATGCTMIPCCVNGPYNEYSRSYDYFECGYN